MLGGAAVSVGLPLLDCFLNGNGTALAQGAPLPVRFGTWFWGCGMNPDRWVPSRGGRGLRPAAGARGAGRPCAEHVSVLSGFNTVLDGRPNLPHWTGVMATLTGSVPSVEPEVPAPTLDVLISERIGTSTRFRSLEMNATGVPGQSYSRGQREHRQLQHRLAARALHAHLRARLHRSAAAARSCPIRRPCCGRASCRRCARTRRASRRGSAATTAQRLDQYFTSLRQLENQIEVSLTPPDLEACRRPRAPMGENIGTDLEQATSTHRLMTRAAGVRAALRPDAGVQHALLVGHLGAAQERRRRPRITSTPTTSWSTRCSAISRKRRPSCSNRCRPGPSSSSAWRRRRRATARLLDNCLVLAHSESSFAKSHQVTLLPVMIAGTRRRPRAPGPARARQRRAGDAHRAHRPAGHGPAGQRVGNGLAAGVASGQRHPRLIGAAALHARRGKSTSCPAASSRSSRAREKLRRWFT